MFCTKSSGLKYRKIKKFYLFSKKFFSTEEKYVCIVGSGPAGFYTAQHLLRKNKCIKVDIFEKLPVPFGLIRYGVAPDHPEIKKCINGFTTLAKNDRVNFYGNIDVGKDISVGELLRSYHAVVLAYGASENKLMQIPGETCINVLPARQIVGWYTGHPDNVNDKIDLDTDVAAIIGHGNVALDIARILLRKVDDLKGTDISENAFETLKKSRIKRIILIGRRGPLQVSFTIKEFRELANLENCQIEMLDDEIRNLQIDVEGLGRPLKRFVGLMQELFLCQPTKGNNVSTNAEKTLELKFCRTPKEFIPDEQGKVKQIVLTKNVVQGTYSPEAVFQETSEQEIIDCGLVVKSVGYKSVSIDPILPFNETKNIIRQRNGKAIDLKGLYCSGWVKTGSVGVILSTMRESYATAETIVEDIKNDELLETLPSNKDSVFKTLEEKGVQITTFEDWEKMDKLELEIGAAKGKVREKLYTVEDMLKACKR